MVEARRVLISRQAPINRTDTYASNVGHYKIGNKVYCAATRLRLIPDAVNEAPERGERYHEALRLRRQTRSDDVMQFEIIHERVLLESMGTELTKGWLEPVDVAL